MSGIALDAASDEPRARSELTPKKHLHIFAQQKTTPDGVVFRWSSSFSGRRIDTMRNVARTGSSKSLRGRCARYRQLGQFVIEAWNRTLITFDELGFEGSGAVPRDLHLHLSPAGPEPLQAVTIPAVGLLLWRRLSFFVVQMLSQLSAQHSVHYRSRKGLQEFLWLMVLEDFIEQFVLFSFLASWLGVT